MCLCTCLQVSTLSLSIKLVFLNHIFLFLVMVYFGLRIRKTCIKDKNKKIFTLSRMFNLLIWGYVCNVFGI